MQFYGCNLTHTCRFGTNFLMFQRLLEVKGKFKHMVMSSDWKWWASNLAHSARDEAKEVAGTIKDTRGFWACIQEICTVMEPAYVMMKLLDLKSDERADSCRCVCSSS
jgi:hypothetical protein